MLVIMLLLLAENGMNLADMAVNPTILGFCLSKSITPTGIGATEDDYNPAGGCPQS